MSQFIEREKILYMSDKPLLLIQQALFGKKIYHGIRAKNNLCKITVFKKKFL